LLTPYVKMLTYLHHHDIVMITMTFKIHCLSGLSTKKIKGAKWMKKK
jgi:hypothetical protein